VQNHGNRVVDPKQAAGKELFDAIQAVMSFAIKQHIVPE